MDNLNDVRREAGRHFMNRLGEYVKDTIKEFVTNSKNKNNGDLYRGMTEYKSGYKPRSNLV
jgi:hypothetical protein